MPPVVQVDQRARWVSSWDRAQAYLLVFIAILLRLDPAPGGGLTQTARSGWKFCCDPLVICCHRRIEAGLSAFFGGLRQRSSS